MPSLANGNLGFTIYGDSIYMNGIYNGEAGNSRRARIPNWLNVTVANLTNSNDQEILQNLQADSNEMNLKHGFFQSRQYFNNRSIAVSQKYYAHRYFNRALVYEFRLSRLVMQNAGTISLEDMDHFKIVLL